MIEALGALYAAGSGEGEANRVAVLCIDPSSAVTGGSILGDKTRMAKLSQMENVFIRPSAAGKALGGLSAMTHKQVALLESAGYNVVLVETVGVGQSEHAVRTLVDTVILVLSPAGGDSLQGMKRGLVELSHVIAVNKCDGPLKEQANATCSEYRMAVSLLHSASSWKVPVLRVSAVDGLGLPALISGEWSMCVCVLCEFFSISFLASSAVDRHRESIGNIEEARARNVWEAIWSRVQEQALEGLQSHPTVLQQQEIWTRKMQLGEMTADDISDRLFALLLGVNRSVTEQKK